jgi:hypothetical protein
MYYQLKKFYLTSLATVDLSFYFLFTNCAAFDSYRIYPNAELAEMERLHVDICSRHRDIIVKLLYCNNSSIQLLRGLRDSLFLCVLFSGHKEHEENTTNTK